MQHSQPNLDRRIKNIFDTLPHVIELDDDGDFHPSYISIDHGTDNEQYDLSANIIARANSIEINYTGENGAEIGLETFELDDPNPLEDEADHLKRVFYEGFGRTVEELS